MSESWRQIADQIDDCKYIHVWKVEHTERPWGVRVLISEAVSKLYPENPERDFAPELAQGIREAMQQEPQPVPRSFEVIFEDCISWTVTNETYAMPTGKKYSGKCFRTFDESRLLEFAKQTTYEFFIDPSKSGTLRHYQIAGLDDIVDVIATTDPVIFLVPFEPIAAT